MTETDLAPKPKAKAKPKTNGKSKTQAVVALLMRKGGCTRKDILAATGWPSVSVDAVAKSAKLKLTRKADGKILRYWGAAK